MDVWIQAGGSNTWGDNGAWDGDWVSNPPCTQPRPGLIKMWSVPNQTWVDAVKNVHTVGRTGGAPSDTTGVDIPFARALLDLGLSRQVGFVPAAMAGTSMFANWQPSNQDQYPKLVNQTRLAMKSIGKKGRLAGLVMMLGEGDAMLIYNTVSAYNPDGTVWSSYFGLLMSGMLEFLREELQDLNPNLPIIIALQAVQNRQRVYPWIESIRNQTIVMDLPNLVKADMEGCRIYQVDMASWDGWLGIDPSVGWQGIHLSRTGQCCMGQRMAVAYAKARTNFTKQPDNTNNKSLNETLVDEMSNWPFAPLIPPSPPLHPPNPPPMPPSPSPPPRPPMPPGAPNYTQLAIDMLYGKSG